MKIITWGMLLINILGFANPCFCQKNDKKKIPPPLYVVMSSTGDTLKGRVVIIAPQEYKKINILKGETALQKYGPDGEFGVVEVTLKSNSEIFDVNSMKKFLKLEKYNKVNFTINGECPIASPLVVTKNCIKKITRQIVKENEEITVNFGNDKPILKPKPGEIVVIQ